jgi:hypothetical protein
MPSIRRIRTLSLRTSVTTTRFTTLILGQNRSQRGSVCLAHLSGRIRTCGQNKLNAHLFGEERVDVGFEDQWIDSSSMADRDPTLMVDKNGQRHFSQMAWINKRPTTSITPQVTP